MYNNVTPFIMAQLASRTSFTQPGARKGSSMRVRLIQGHRDGGGEEEETREFSWKEDSVKFRCPIVWGGIG